MIRQTITFKNGTKLPTIAVYSNNTLIQNAYRECFEIRFPVESVDYDTISSLATADNLSAIVLTERDDETDEIIAQFSHFNFTIVTSLGMKTEPTDGSKFFFLSVAQKSDTELRLEKLIQDNEDTQEALMELAEIVSGEV